MEASPIEVQESLKGIDYPVQKKELIQHAKKHGANEEVMEVLESLPDKEYTSPIEVSKEFSESSSRGESSRGGRESSKGGRESSKGGRESSKGKESSRGGHQSSEGKESSRGSQGKK